MSFVKLKRQWRALVLAAVGALCLSGCGGDDKSGGGGNDNPGGADDSGSYGSAELGGNRWMKRNLNIAAGNSWCYNNSQDNCAKYGRLYDWNTARTVCPSGWRLPTNQEWGDLVAAAGGSSAGKRLKAKSGWNDNNGQSGNGTDDFGFSALPGGGRNDGDGGFNNVGNYGYWWTGTEDDDGHAYYRSINNYYDNVRGGSEKKGYGHSVRCVGAED